ncbi:hypothetical protein EPUS_06217 [Endocarpon pusillum Z07020]|uniref:HIT domain-containing protein n=1 Tax=Endocarpon pusillum (strain Z07020 / HMAS-L-300199) TaxID=1263415 RepID=U1GC80_ENDPU|nr:uncharacterized protein EPUS_06217 [Endocarpon pusillum Z07020]ERF75177.1 hypothetical protein EPUS_06217 [Endocarpon pusillum Z07020]
MRGNRKAPESGPQQADNTVQDLGYSEDCPFCNISLAYPSVSPLNDPQRIARILHHEKTSPPCVVIYSGEHVMAFLDIQPLTWGHTLVIPRRHRVKMGDLEAVDAAELGRHLPLIARAVMRAVFDIQYNPEKLQVEGADYNIVQNNGPLAAQVVPHIHHHIIPRPSDPIPRFHQNGNPAPSQLPKMTSKYHTSWTMFGRGYRTDLDENDPETQQLAQRMRYEIAREFSRGEIDSSYGTSLFKHPNTTGAQAPHLEATPYVDSASPDSTLINTRNPDHKSTTTDKDLHLGPHSEPSKPSGSEKPTPKGDSPLQPEQALHRIHRISNQSTEPSQEGDKTAGSGPGFQGANVIPVAITQRAAEEDSHPPRSGEKNGKEKL